MMCSYNTRVRFTFDRYNIFYIVAIRERGRKRKKHMMIIYYLYWPMAVISYPHAGFKIL